MLDKFRDECGVFGVYGHPEAANLTYLGLYSLQHRGQESTGIVSYDKKFLYCHKDMGLVADVFTPEKLAELHGDFAIGHVRYSTSGGSLIKNAQPIVVDYARGSLAVAHNGNFVNAQRIRRELEEEGSIFTSTSDSEVLVHLIALSRREDFIEALTEGLEDIKGAYSFVMMTENKMIGLRDPSGFRPLSIGILDGAYILTSESCALDLIGAELVRDVEPGEIVWINKDGLHSVKPFKKAKEYFCSFEYIYFARPDSLLNGETVATARKKLGKELAIEQPAEADVVIPLPDSGIYAAQGYAEMAQIPLEFGMIRNHYVGRTFIEPRQSIRHFGVKVKLNPVRKFIEGKRVVIVDDSLVRGTTSRKIVKMLRKLGAKEVHMRIAAPPSIYPCFYGIDTPTEKELIGSTHTIKEIRDFLTADSLGYLSIEGLERSVCSMKNKLCLACFSGNYPIKIVKEEERKQRLFERM